MLVLWPVSLLCARKLQGRCRCNHCDWSLSLFPRPHMCQWSHLLPQRHCRQWVLSSNDVLFVLETCGEDNAIARFPFSGKGKSSRVRGWDYLQSAGANNFCWWSVSTLLVSWPWFRRRLFGCTSCCDGCWKLVSDWCCTALSRPYLCGWCCL